MRTSEDTNKQSGLLRLRVVNDFVSFHFVSLFFLNNNHTLLFGLIHYHLCHRVFISVHIQYNTYETISHKVLTSSNIYYLKEKKELSDSKLDRSKLIVDETSMGNSNDHDKWMNLYFTKEKRKKKKRNVYNAKDGQRVSYLFLVK